MPQRFEYKFLRTIEFASSDGLEHEINSNLAHDGWRVIAFQHAAFLDQAGVVQITPVLLLERAVPV